MKINRRVFKSGLLGLLFAIACAAGVMPERLRAETVTLTGEVDATEIHAKLDALGDKLDRVLERLAEPGGGGGTGGDTGGGTDDGGNDSGGDDPGALWINPSFYGERPIITGKRDGVYQVDPDYAALLSKYDGVRYLNWSANKRWGVNRSWADRVNDDLSQDAPGGEPGGGRWSSLDAKWHKTGLPLEAIIDVANATQTDVWWTGPIQSGTDFYKQAGRLFAERLDPGLRVVVEVGNEVWDAGRGKPYYDQTNSFADAMRLYARDAAAKFAAFTDGGFPADRLTRVVGGQLHQVDVLRRHVVPHLSADEFDAVTCSGYFGNSAHKGEHWRTGKHGLLDSITALHAHADLAESINKQLIIYELNHHVEQDRALAESDAVIDGVQTMIDTARSRGVTVIALFQGAGDVSETYHWSLYRRDLTPRRTAIRLKLPTAN